MAAGEAGGSAMKMLYRHFGPEHRQEEDRVDDDAGAAGTAGSPHHFFHLQSAAGRATRRTTTRARLLVVHWLLLLCWMRTEIVELCWMPDGHLSWPPNSCSSSLAQVSARGKENSNCGRAHKRNPRQQLVGNQLVSSLIVVAAKSSLDYEVRYSWL